MADKVVSNVSNDVTAARTDSATYESNTPVETKAYSANDINQGFYNDPAKAHSIIRFAIEFNMDFG